MNKLNKKQKITLIILASILLAGFCYYTYINENKLAVNENLEITNNIEENKSVSETKNKIKVHILGAVNIEGIVELEENSRIADAVEAAGGFKENACKSEVNLACILEDGMQIRIPTNEEVAEEKEKNTNTVELLNSINNQTEASQGNLKGNVGKRKSKININTASQSMLETLPGIGQATALKIITYRNENGKFKEVAELKKVKGIGESKFNSIKDLITI